MTSTGNTDKEISAADRGRVLGLLNQAALDEGLAPEIEPMASGITNRSFLVTLSEQQVVVRLSTELTAVLGIDRNKEMYLQRIGASLGVAPATLYFDSSRGDNITRFIAAPADKSRWSDEGVRAQEVGRLLKTLHSAELDSKQQFLFDPVDDIIHWAIVIKGSPIAEQASESVADVPSLFEKFMSGDEANVLCHNDLDPGNILFDDSRGWLIDWEYAGVGDYRFDLASYARHLSLDGRQELLDSYCVTGKPSLSDLNNWVSCFRGWTAVWALAQHVLREDTDFDYYTYASDIFSDLENVKALGT